VGTKSHNALHAIAHNFAASISGGLSFIAPDRILGFDIYSRNEVRENGQMVIDFLNQKLIVSDETKPLDGDLQLISNAFPAFCEKHDVSCRDFNVFVVRFTRRANGAYFVVTVESKNGKRTSREYAAIDGSRTPVLDTNERRRPATFVDPVD